MCIKPHLSCMENKCYSHVAENLFWKWPPLTFDVLLVFCFVIRPSWHLLTVYQQPVWKRRRQGVKQRRQEVFSTKISVRKYTEPRQAFVLKYFGVSGVRWENFQLQKSMKTVCCFVTWTELWSVVFLFEAYIEFFSRYSKECFV